MAVSLAIALVTSACVATVPAPQASAEPATQEPVRGGRLVLSGGDQPSLQPVVREPLGFLYYLYEALAPIDPASGQAIDGMGKVSQSKDGRTLTVDITGAAFWSDGRPIVAEDWLTTIKGVGHGNTKCPGGAPRCTFGWITEFDAITRIVGWAEFVSGQRPDIAGIRADGKRLTVEFSEVRCAAATLFGVLPPIPAHVFGKYVKDAASSPIDSAPENVAPTIFSGPFVLKEWRRGEHLTLARNDRYWRGPPLLDEVVFKFLAPTAVIDQIASGGVMGGVLGKSMEPGTLERVPSIRIARVREHGYTYIGWNIASASAPALRDVRVRQALAYGLDVDRYIRDVLPSAARVHGHFPQTSWAHTPGLNEYRYDPARAASLLRSAGYEKDSAGVASKDGRPLSIRLTTNANNPRRLALLQFASDQYASLGIRIVKNPRPTLQDVIPALNSGDIDGVIIGWALPPDPDSRNIFHSASIPAPQSTTGDNWTRFSNGDVDRALSDAGSPANGDCSIATRKRHYATVERILNEEQPYAFGFAETNLFVLPANLRGLEPSTHQLRFGDPNIYRWWLAKDGARK